MSIYQEEILAHYRDPQNYGRIQDTPHTCHLNNPLCGDIIDLDVVIKDGTVVDCKYEARGCAISIASASLLSEYIKGKPKEELLRLDKNSIIELLGIELSPNRLKCALLPLEALHTALT